MKSKPFLLDELDKKFVYLWKYLLQGKRLNGITDAKLNNLQALWLSKYRAWIPEGSAGIHAWMGLVNTSLHKEFKGEFGVILTELIKNGIFFDTLDLYHGILKEKIETK